MPPLLARPVARWAAVAAVVLAPCAARAQSVDFQGQFTRDDQHQFFAFQVLTPGTVSIRSYGYAGGTTPSGLVVPRGGFDTILSLFSATGAFIAENDDGPGAPTDPATGLAADAAITTTLAPGSYFAAVTQYDNFANGAMGTGFSEDGRATFTNDPAFSPAAPCPGGFRDASGTAGRCRTGNYTVAFSGSVASVALYPTQVAPEPAPCALLGTGLLAVGGVARRRRRTTTA